MDGLHHLFDTGGGAITPQFGDQGGHSMGYSAAFGSGDFQVGGLVTGSGSTLPSLPIIALAAGAIGLVFLVLKD